MLIKPQGEIDFASSAQFRGALHSLLNDASARHIIVNMAAVTFLDSIGLGAFVDLRRLLKERDGSLHLFAVTDLVRRTLETTRIIRLLPVHATELEAREAIYESDVMYYAPPIMHSPSMGSCA